MVDPNCAIKPRLWLVIPCYNEEATLPISAPLLVQEIDLLVSDGRVSKDSVVLFVDDGSTDATWPTIQRLADDNGRVLGLSLSRNCGHQNALMAGLMEARGKCDVVVSCDCDGQDDITAIRRMLDEWEAGAEVVYGVRSNRDSDTAFKRTSARAFYRLMGWMGADIVPDHADFRLMGARALDGLSEFGEVNLFLRGLVPLVGFPSTEVTYERLERVAGESHYPIGKMIGLAVDGVTSLSIKPMRMVMGAGFVFFLLGLVLAIWALVTALLGNAVAGWASTICIVSVIGGLQLLALGMIGEYVGKAYLETKRRPRYIVRQRVGGPGGGDTDAPRCE